MKPEIVEALRGMLSRLPLGTTAGNRTQQGDRLLTAEEIRQSLKAHDTAIDALITDAVKRRRDIGDLATEQVAVHSAVADLRYDENGQERSLEPPAPPPQTPTWVVVLQAAAVGGFLALHGLEIGAIAYLVAR